jgi:hypothetical protein
MRSRTWIDPLGPSRPFGNGRISPSLSPPYAVPGGLFDSAIKHGEPESNDQLASSWEIQARRQSISLAGLIISGRRRPRCVSLLTRSLLQVRKR